jgi:hypothetical protein
MHDAALVGRFDRLGDLGGHVERLAKRQRPTSEAGREGLARDELQYEERRVPRLFEPVDRGDVGVIQAREGLCFAPEPCQPLGIKGELGGERLERHVTGQARVARPIDFSHAACTEMGQDVVGTDMGSELQGHGPGTLA